MIENRLHITEFLSHTKTNEYYCEYWNIICVKEGSLSITVSDRVYILNSGDVALCLPNQPFYIFNDDSAKYHFYSFKAKGDLLNSLKTYVFSVSDNELQLLEYAKTDSFSEKQPLNEQIFLASLELFILRAVSLNISVVPLEEKNAIIFGKACDILREKADSQISVEELAERLKISLSNLKRIFSCFTGIGVHEYFTLLKITKAKELILSGESVTETASLTGFANQAYFSAAFKRVTGLSPKEYSRLGNKSTKTKQSPKTKKENLPSYLL